MASNHSKTINKIRNEIKNFKIFLNEVFVKKTYINIVKKNNIGEDLSLRLQLS